MDTRRRSVAAAVSGLCIAALAGCRDYPPAAGPGAVAPTAQRAGATGPRRVAADDDSAGTEIGAEGDEPSLPPAERGVAREVGAAGVAAEVDRVLAAVRATTYSHVTHVDEARGEFDVDCSGFAAYALSLSAPQALADLQQATVARPLARHFEAFFASLRPGEGSGRWVSVPRAPDLQVGDLIAWVRAPDVVSRNSGHVMFVHGPPSPYEGRSDAFVIPVADATHGPHGKSDARTAGTSGLGLGSVVLLTDGDGRPIGYKWSTWSKSVEHRTAVALGRVVR